MIIDYAYKNDILEDKTPVAFVNFLRNSSKDDKYSPLEELSFKDVVESVREPLSVNSLVEKLEIISERLGMPKVHASMITRLKQDFNPNTAKKRAALRILSYWISKNRPQFEWNYEKFLELPQSTSRDRDNVKEMEGVVMTIDIQGRGDTVEPGAVQWLKKTLPICINDLKLYKHIDKSNIYADSTTSLTLRLPKKTGLLGEPRVYNQAIRDSLAIAHQMAVKWLLSGYSSQQRVIIIAIYAGSFFDAKIFLRPLLEARLSEDPTILLTDFAYLCSRVAEVKVVFKRHLDFGSAKNINAWSVKYFWSYTYYDFIPDLLEEKMLPTNRQSYEQFKQELYFPDESKQHTFQALSIMHRFPQNALLQLEIAKVLVARRMFYEADTILSQILLIHPYYVIARIIRMMIYLSLAIEQQDFAASETCFERAITEGNYIVSYYNNDEEVWCEIGLVYYGRALKYLRSIRAGEVQDETQVTESNVFEFLRKAEEAFTKGMTVSATGKDNRSIFWLVYTQSLIKLLLNDRELFQKNSRETFDDVQNIYKQVGLQFFSVLGWVPSNVVKIAQTNALDRLPDLVARKILEQLLSLMNVYENSVLARNYLPNIKYAFCCFIWDFAPKLTIYACKQILHWLNETRTEAEKLIAPKIGIYAVTIFFSQFQPPEEFIECVEVAIEIVGEFISDEDSQRDDDIWIDNDKLKELSKKKLMLSSIDKKIDFRELV